MKLSIVIPVFNEERTVQQVLEKVTSVKFPGIEREIIVVDDGSTDDTISIISKFTNRVSRDKHLQFIKHKKNQGKGAAVRTGIEHATGDYIVIQDADLEYNPQDIVKLIEPIKQGKAEVVYGTRLNKLPDFKGEQSTPQFFLHYLGNKFLSLITSVIYLQWVTDMETCYKIFPRKVALTLNLQAKGFELEPEITAKLLKRRYTFYELPINVSPRSYGEGKKIHAGRDGVRALWALIKYRFID